MNYIGRALELYAKKLELKKEMSDINNVKRYILGLGGVHGGVCVKKSQDGSYMYAI